MPKRGRNFPLRLLLVFILSFSLVQNAVADILNGATASGTYQAAPVISGNSLVSIPVTLATPALELLKSSTFNDDLVADGSAQVGETITYSFSVRNTGSVSLANVTIADPTVAVVGGPLATLAPTVVDTTTFTATYTLVAGDLVAGSVTNSAIASAFPPSGPAITDVSDSQNPGDDTGADNDPTVTSLVTASMAANDDDFSAAPVNGLAGGSTATVYGNDTLNGLPFVPAAVTPSITANGGLAGVAISAAGTLIIPAGTSANTHTVTYRICEVAIPANCDTADVIVVVGAAAIAATDDDFSATPVIGLTGGITATVFTNDSLNGGPFLPASVGAAIAANGGLVGVTMNPSGTINVPAATPAGSYTVTYQICEVLNPANCDAADVIVAVGAAAIVANDDNFLASPIGGVTGGTTATVYGNDTLNGAAFLPAAVTGSITADGGLTGVTINASGTLSIPAGTAVNTYTVTYRICEVLNPANCDTADVIVAVNAATMVASDDDFSASPVNGLAGGFTATAFTNDLLNGAAFAPAAVMATITADGGLTGVAIDGNGLLSVPPNTIANTYVVTYRICDVLNGANCDTANVTIVVAPPALVANDDDFSAVPVDGLAGGATATVFTNDTLNGVAFAPATVTASIAANGGLAGVSINANGTLTIPAGTPGNAYTVTYQICEVLNPANCDTADAIVVVADVAAIEGTVFYDLDGNGLFGGGDTDAGTGYLVELYDSSGLLLGSDTTNASGFYSIATVPGVGYRLLFKRPGGVAVGQITGLTLPSGLTVADQNQPIDPSGIVYNSLTRLPMAGVTVTITDAGGIALPAACLIDASQQNQTTLADGAYRFDIVPACLAGETEFLITFVNPVGYAPGVSVTLPPTAGPLQVTGCSIVPAACQISGSAAPPPAPGGATYYLSFLLENGDPHVVNNHIPIDPIISTAAGFTKRALVTEARRGERVPYVIEAMGVGFSPARIVDIIPPGFDFVAGSATSNAAPVVPTIAGRNLTFDGLVPDGLGAIRLELVLVASIAVATGPHVNTAQLINPLTNALVSTARATVTITAEHVFDCGDIIGRVFDDKNRNGYQDERERGLAGVRLVTVKGVLITTDKNGLFHVACADVPDADIGSNFILKLDIRTLPEGYNVTTENPRIVRLTSGKMTKLNFGAAGARLVRFDMTNDAFVSGSTALKPQWLKSIDKLMAVLEQGNATLRLTYIAKTSGSNLAMDRAAAVEKLITERWAEIGGRYRLSIETRVAGPK